MSIEEICKKYGIENYTINDDGSIDVDGDVLIWGCNLNEMPLKINKVTGNFNCSENAQNDLKGSPRWVGGSFYSRFNNLTTLEGCPEKVDGDFYIDNSKLTNLKGCTKYIGGEFDCSDNELTSLEGCPKSIGQGFYVDRNCLSDLDFIPDSMVGDFYCDNNILESVFNGVNIDFLRAFKSFKIIQDNVVNLKRLKYLMSMFDKPIDLEEIKKYYTIS